jgi:hypothetical protein
MRGLARPSDSAARREWWRRQIERQRSGNIPVAELCRRLGVCVQTFYYWKRRLHPAARAASPGIVTRNGSQRRSPPVASTAAFVPVSLREAASGASLEVELANDCVVRLNGRVDARLLQAAIRAAGQLGGSRQGGD